jgi:hypothetical protein
MPTDSAPHLIVPFAQSAGDGWLEAVTPLMFKNLDLLLRGMKLVDTDAGEPDSLSPPHERVWANALQLAPSPAGGRLGMGAAGHGDTAGPHPSPLPGGEGVSQDGLIPWAALEAKAKPNEGWAVITPCHWAMGREHATLTDPATLGLDEAESRMLLAAMQPYFATEGITLHYTHPTRWLAESDVFRNLPTASLDRVLGRNVDRWLPASKQIKLLQNEMQMLLYTHPVNDERAAKGLRSVNSFWVSGSGALTEAATANPTINVNRGLAASAFASDWTVYSQAWTQLDTSDIAQLLAQQKGGKTVRISLCGESNAMTFETAQHGLLSKIRNALSPQHTMTVLKQL